jgi:hypothetical protein
MKTGRERCGGLEQPAVQALAATAKRRGVGPLVVEANLPVSPEADGSFTSWIAVISTSSPTPVASRELFSGLEHQQFT